MEAACRDMMPRMQTMMRLHGGVPGAGVGIGKMPWPNADADGDGTVPPEGPRGRLRDLPAEHDSEADGSPSPEEFAAPHAAPARPGVADRLRLPDDDGNGAETATQIDKPARLMGRMQALRAMRGRSMRRPRGRRQARCGATAR